MAPLLTRLGQSFGFGASSGGVQPFSATGGDVVHTDRAGYKVHIFNPQEIL